MRQAVICEPVRTPIGRYGGMFKSQSAVDLGVAALKGLLERTGLVPEAVQDVILGHCYPNSEAPAIGRVVALDSGLPVTVPGMQVDRRCGSGLQAVIQACLQVGNGDHDLVIAGGCESMSNVAFYSTDMRWGGARSGVQIHDGLARGRSTAGGRHYPVPGGMMETAENLRRQYGISRLEQDELAVRSHQRAVAAQKDGILASEIVPVIIPASRTRQGEERVDTDEHPRADTSVESLSKLKPVLLSGDPEATVTAGNACPLNDGAAAVVVMSDTKAKELGITPLARIVASGVTGLNPEIMGLGPVEAIKQVLKRANMTIDDIDLVEINEAFAAQVVPSAKELGISYDKLNVNGGAIALGHPLGASGAKLMATLLNELERTDGRYGLLTMCEGGGMANATIIERLG